MTISHIFAKNTPLPPPQKVPNPPQNITYSASGRLRSVYLHLAPNYFGDTQGGLGTAKGEWGV